MSYLLANRYKSGYFHKIWMEYYCFGENQASGTFFSKFIMCQSPSRLILENKGMHVVYITQKGQTSSVKGHSCGFLPLIFSNLGYNAKPPK